MGRESKLAKNTFILSLGTFLPRLTSFVTLPILTGALSQTEYGTYDLITILVSLYLPALTLQLQTAAFRFLIDSRNNKQEVGKIITNIVGFVCACSCIALVALFFFLGSYDPWIKSLICLYFFFDLIMNVMLQVARGLALNFEYSISSIIGSALQMILAVVLVSKRGNGLTGALLALLISAIVQTLYLSIKIKITKYISFTYLSNRTIKELVSYSWPMVPNNMSMWVMRVSDRFIVTAFMGASANAIYSVANKIPNILSQLQGTFTMAWQENASIFANDEDVDIYYSSMFRFIYNFMAGALGLLIASTPVLFKILIRGDYELAYKQMPVLFYGMFFSCMASYLGGIYIAFKATKSVGVTTTVSAFLNVIIDFVMIKWAGLYAASISTLLSYLFLFVFRLYDVKKLIKLRYNMKHLFLVQIVLILECYISSKQIFYLDLLNIFISVFAFIILNCKFLSKMLRIFTNTLKEKFLDKK